MFPLDEDVKVYRLIKAGGAPVKMFWFCGGHGQCAEGNGGEEGAGLDVGSILGSGGGDPRLERATAAWLARYLKGDTSVNTGPEFEFLSDDRKYRSAPQYPVAARAPIEARGSGRLSIEPGATSGGGVLAAPVEEGALELPIAVRRRSQLLGPPRLKLTYSGTGSPSATRVFAQLVNVGREVVVGNQPTPIPVRLDGKRHTVTRSLVPIASSAAAGDRYVLQLVAGSAVWATQRTRGSLNAARIEIELPVADPRGLGRRGLRCWTERSFVVVPGKGVRSRVVGGRIMRGREQIGRIRSRGKGGRVRFGPRAYGAQRLRLVLRLSDGRTVTQRRTLVLCGPAL